MNRTILRAGLAAVVVATAAVFAETGMGVAEMPATARAETAKAPRRLTLHVAAATAANRGDGSEQRPFQTLTEARNAVRAARGRGQTVEVAIRGGTYELREPLTLGTADGGTADAPVVWRAAAGETVRIVGGRMVHGLKPITDAAVRARLAPEARSNILTLDLRAQGVTDYGDPQGGFSIPSDTGMELFVDDAPMTLSRYPNTGFIRIAEVLGKTPVNAREAKGTKEGVFRIDDPRMGRWVGEKDPRVLGYWFWDWADQRQKIASLDPAARTITLQEPWHGSGYRQGQYFYAFNLLSEIDQPGEWYLDREEGRLYVWPPAYAHKKTPQRLMVSLLPAIVRLENARHIIFRGVTFEGARGNAVEVQDSENCALIACTLRNTGKWAVQVRGGHACAVRGCEIYGVGEGGVELGGGDRATLAPGAHVVENCHIHDYSRWVRTYQPVIRLAGVGNRAVRNLIHDAPHQAFAIAGNDHLVEANEVHNVCEETNDAGAIYGWHDWAARGNVIRNNWFHHIYGREGRGANGVYLDDNFSSATIENNVFQTVQRAVHLGGRRDHRVVNNLFVDCPDALHIDARGLGWRAYGREELQKTLEAQPYRQPPWSVRYPELLTLLENEPMAPVGNEVTRNVIVGERWNDIEDKAKPYVAMTGNLLGVDSTVLVQKAAGEIPRVNAATAKKIGFKPISYAQIGVYASADRALWSVRHPVTVRDWAAPGSDVAPHPAALTPLEVSRVLSPPVADGQVAEGEYSSRAIRLEETPGREKIRTPAAMARLGHDNRRLYVAITIPLSQVAKLQQKGGWGASDGVEVALRLDGARPGPIFILQGFPDGRLTASLEGGASQAATDKLRDASAFAATVEGDSWTAEFAIDLASAGISAKPGTMLGFNIGARRTETDDWIAWTGTGSANWKLAGAGRIVLR